MRMWEGSGRLVNTLGPSDQHVPGSVELVTFRARRPSPGPSWSRLCRLRSPLRTATVAMVGVARRSPAGLRRPAIRWAAVSPVQVPPRCGRDPLRTAAVLTARLTGGALSAAARFGRVGELAGRLVPVSQAPNPGAALLYARPAGPESVTVSSTEWVDWLIRRVTVTPAASPIRRARLRARPSGSTG